MANEAYHASGKQNRYERAARALQANAALTKDPYKLGMEIGCPASSAIATATYCIDAYLSMFMLVCGVKFDGDWRYDFYTEINANPGISVDELARRFGFSYSKAYWARQSFFANYKVLVPIQ